MVTFVSGHQRIFWNLLFTTGLWGSTKRIKPSENTITIVSPWMTDITSEGSGWPEELANQACSSSGDMGSLKMVLRALIQMGFNVRIVVMDRDGKWLSKNERRMLKNETDFIEQMSAYGATCERRKDMHFKWLCTPVGLWKGSSNSTANGLFGRLQEQNDLFIVGSHDTEYQEQKEIMEFEIQYSVPYFDIVNDITTAGIELDFSVVETETTGHLSPSELHHAPHEPLDIGDYPPFVPSNYSPIGQINPDILDDLSDQERDSIKVWINQTVERLLSFIDFVFVEGAHFTELEENTLWIDSFSIQTLDKEIMKLSESSQVEVDGSMNELTSHEVLFRIKDRFHILQSCGIAVSENGAFIQSVGTDAAGIDIRPVYSEILMKYLPVDGDANYTRVDRLFNLVYNMVRLTCYVVQSETLPRNLAKELSDCLLEIESQYLNPIEEYY